jgi:hypothetical protein
MLGSPDPAGVSIVPAMLGLVIGLIAVAHAAAIPPADDRRQLYQACPGQDVLQRATNVEWGTPQSRIDWHRALRDRLHAPLPEGATRILWYANSSHLVTTSFSVIAVRGADGRWHVDGAGETVPWIDGAQPTPMSRMERDLSPEEGRRLDSLLEDPCLYAGPTSLTDPHGLVGGMAGTLEIEMPARHWIGTWFAVTTPQEDGVLQMIGGH